MLPRSPGRQGQALRTPRRRWPRRVAARWHFRRSGRSVRQHRV